LLLPCSIIGYWISNIAGILLMQVGAIDVFQNQPKERNLKKELLMGLVSSAVYTVVIVLLIQFKILQAPVLFSGI
jgi:phosphotransferase system  glucose/maltose/N-acetylglucosamine-specific IIC component